jgi:hypothetical protein
MNRKIYCIITGIMAVLGIIQFLAMVETVEYAVELAFFRYGLLCLIQTANLTSYLTRLHCSGQGIKGADIIGALLGIVLLAAFIWIVTMWYIIS